MIADCIVFKKDKTLVKHSAENSSTHLVLTDASTKIANHAGLIFMKGMRGT